jgi:hypothetical protein
MEDLRVVVLTNTSLFVVLVVPGLCVGEYIAGT